MWTSAGVLLRRELRDCTIVQSLAQTRIKRHRVCPWSEIAGRGGRNLQQAEPGGGVEVQIADDAQFLHLSQLPRAEASGASNCMCDSLDSHFVSSIF